MPIYCSPWKVFLKHCFVRLEMLPVKKKKKKLEWVTVRRWWREIKHFTRRTDNSSKTVIVEYYFGWINRLKQIRANLRLRLVDYVYGSTKNNDMRLNYLQEICRETSRRCSKNLSRLNSFSNIINNYYCSQNSTFFVDERPRTSDTLKRHLRWNRCNVFGLHLSQ